MAWDVHFVPAALLFDSVLLSHVSTHTSTHLKTFVHKHNRFRQVDVPVCRQLSRCFNNSWWWWLVAVWNVTSAAHLVTFRQQLLHQPVPALVLVKHLHSAVRHTIAQHARAWQCEYTQLPLFSLSHTHRHTHMHTIAC